ncbi:MAG: hypothetical protein FJY88_13205 [Candidatus Eisenbacteria bacterium]|nr:hypothetical protein [Candidatus Eisenbacteria bacterium]
MAPIESATPEEIACWRKLVRRGRVAGLRKEVAEDLAGQTLLKAIETFDPARGAFPAFCRAIHANLVKNYWRDRKPEVGFDPEIHDTPGGEDLLESILSGEEREMLAGIAERIRDRLSPAEDAFFLTLAEILQDRATGAVSEAARRLGLTPLQGHDVLRRIVRKARIYREQFLVAMGEKTARASQFEYDLRDEGLEAAGAPTILHAEVHHMAQAAPMRAPRDIEPIDPFLFLAASQATAGYERFAATLSPEQRERLAAILS